MKNRELLLRGFALVFLVGLLHFVAIKFYFYWNLGWYDYMMHFLGGLTIGVLVIWVLGIENRSLKTFLIIFIAVMAVGIGWEIFEYVYGLTDSTEKYELDIKHDLIMDALGAIVAYYWSTSRTESPT